MRRFGILIPASVLALLLAATPALACGGLIGPNGAVNLLRTTTLAGYHDGVEHYVTAFQFAGGGGAFGSITPLPDVPTSVVKGGDWTLQRLINETDAPIFRAAALDAVGAAASAEELMTVKIDALDLTVLRGGAAEIGVWAKSHGFRLPPDSPEVLDFYANRSPIFLAAAFDADAAAARGQQLGDGTPVHITIPTDNPWVPLRILALGKAATETVQADVYLLTDLRTDRGMEWVPSNAWLTKVAVDGTAVQLGYDLAIDASGAGRPSAIDAGFTMPGAVVPQAPPDLSRLLLALAFVALGLVGVAMIGRARPSAGRPIGW